MKAVFGTQFHFHLMMILTIAVVSVVKGDDAQPPAGEKPAEQASKNTDEEKPKSEEKPKERSLLEKLQDELQKEVDDTPGANPNQAEEGTDKLERAVKGMRNAGGKLDEGITADETQKIQKQVIKDLEDVIDQLENPPPNQGGGGGGGGGGGKGGGSASSSRSRGGKGGPSLKLRRSSSGSGSKGAQSRQQNSGADEMNGQENNEEGTESSKRMREDRKATEEAERRRKLEMDVWGHLPAHLREELLNTYGDRMLPKYEQMVKQFYEALSTQGNSKK